MAKQRYMKRRLLQIALLALIIPFAYPFGRPMLSLSDINFRTMKKMLYSQQASSAEISSTEKSSAETFTTNNAQLSDTVTVYRWRDKNGSWSFGSSPPANVKSYKAISIQSDANLIQGIPQESVKPDDGPNIVLPGDNNEPLTLIGYSAEDVSKIMKSAKEAKAAMEQRYKQEQQVINEMK